MASAKLGVIKFELSIPFVAQKLPGVLFTGFTVYTSSSILNISTSTDERHSRERLSFPFQCLVMALVLSLHPPTHP